MGQKTRMVQIDCNAALDRVNHQGILFKFYSVGVEGSVQCVLTQFLSNRSQYVVVYGCWSRLVTVVSVLGWQLFLLYTAELFSIVEDKLNGCPDGSTLVAVVPSPGVRVAIVI